MMERATKNNNNHQNRQNQFWPVLSDVKWCAKFESEVRLAWNLQTWWVFNELLFFFLGSADCRLLSCSAEFIYTFIMYLGDNSHRDSFRITLSLRNRKSTRELLSLVDQWSFASKNRREWYERPALRTRVCILYKC